MYLLVLPEIAESVAGTVVMPGPVRVQEIVFSPSDPNFVYTETDGYILYRSDDTSLTGVCWSRGGQRCSTYRLRPIDRSRSQHLLLDANSGSH